MATVSEIREAILAAPLETSNFGEVPELGTLYLPPSHLKALRLDAHVVVGGRGVGKSFWTAALRSEPLRKTIPELDGVQVRVGFATDASINDYPDAAVFSALLEHGVDPYDIWRAVIVRWLAASMGPVVPTDDWRQTVAWLREQPEAVARLMEQPRDWRGLIVFDALDRTASGWQQMDQIVRGLMRAILWLKSYRGLYGKVFLRPDQAERTVFNFPDASKLLATRAELSWARHDLHGLLWQRLINAPHEHGVRLRAVCSTVGAHCRENNGVWSLPDEMKREGDLQQRQAFEQLAGPWMGKDKRRGVPYVWAVSHLSDGKGQTSPRSFFAAIKQAAENSAERYAGHDLVLHYESIKRGIQQASDIRVSEVGEDYPWVPDILSCLEGLNVPCESEVIVTRWQGRFASPADVPSDRLPPQHAQQGWPGIIEDLQRLGLIETKRDGRIDMPDLYRVGFKLGRKGGVKPK